MVAIMARHISQLTDMTAAGILASTLVDDNEHDTIIAAAGELVAHGLGHLVYQMQYTSGVTLWVSEKGKSFTVDIYGIVGYVKGVISGLSTA